MSQEIQKELDAKAEEQDEKWLTEGEMQWMFECLVMGIANQGQHAVGIVRLVRSLQKTLTKAKEDKRRWSKRKSAMGQRSLTSRFQVQVISI